MKRIYLLFAMLATGGIGFSQNQASYEQHITILTDTTFEGRGYVLFGAKTAAAYLSLQFQDRGLLPLTENYYQPFTSPMNTFPWSVPCEVDGQVFEEGKDYIPVGYSPSIKFNGKLCWLPDLSTPEGVAEFKKENLKNKALVMTSDQFAQMLEWPEELEGKHKEAALQVELTKKFPIAFPATLQKSQPKLQFPEEEFPQGAKKLKINLRTSFYEAMELINVIGKIEGRTNPDTVLLVTAHYDHVGRVGDAIFPGANDNASGTAMMLSLMEYFSQPQNRPDYSMVFIGFTGEEAGLLGSHYYVDHPIVPLEQTKFVLNLDLLGAGSEGATLVNATIHPEEFALMDSLNTAGGYLPQLKKRGKAANSDHYFFTEAGVPAFFYYSLGEVGGYHDIHDTKEDLEKDQFQGQFDLLREFLEAL